MIDIFIEDYHKISSKLHEYLIDKSWTVYSLSSPVYGHDCWREGHRKNYFFAAVAPEGSIQAMRNPIPPEQMHREAAEKQALRCVYYSRKQINATSTDYKTAVEAFLSENKK